MYIYSKFAHRHTHTHTYIYIYIYMYAFTFVLQIFTGPKHRNRMPRLVGKARVSVLWPSASRRREAGAFRVSEGLGVYVGVLGFGL